MGGPSTILNQVIDPGLANTLNISAQVILDRPDPIGQNVFGDSSLFTDPLRDMLP